MWKLSINDSENWNVDTHEQMARHEIACDARHADIDRALIGLLERLRSEQELDVKLQTTVLLFCVCVCVCVWKREREGERDA